MRFKIKQLKSPVNIGLNENHTFYVSCGNGKHTGILYKYSDEIIIKWNRGLDSQLPLEVNKVYYGNYNIYVLEEN